MKKLNFNIKQIMAYVYMPFLFVILGYGIVFLVASPLIDTISTYASLFIVDEEPKFENEVDSIFKAPDEEKGETISAKEVEIPSYGTHYANIECERIGLSAEIFYGDGYDILKNGVGHYAGSSFPGFGEPIMLAAHRTQHFFPLKDAVIGDVVKITTSYGVYEYEITDIQIRDKTDKTAYDLSQDKEQLIMYTCYPFIFLADSQNRYFVYADKISGPTVEWD